MLFNISSGFLNISTPSLLKMVSKLVNISKIAIFSNIDVKERASCDTYKRWCGCYLKGKCK